MFPRKENKCIRTVGIVSVLCFLLILFLSYLILFLCCFFAYKMLFSQLSPPSSLYLCFLWLQPSFTFPRILYLFTLNYLCLPAPLSQAGKLLCLSSIVITPRSLGLERHSSKQGAYHQSQEPRRDVHTQTLPQILLKTLLSLTHSFL